MLFSALLLLLLPIVEVAGDDPGLLVRVMCSMTCSVRGTDR
jgi:hypothetical protein